MVNIALGIILALVILVVLFVVAAFLTGIYQAARDEVNDEGFGQKVLDGIIFLVKSPIENLNKPTIVVLKESILRSR